MGRQGIELLQHHQVNIEAVQLMTIMFDIDRQPTNLNNSDLDLYIDRAGG